MNDLTKELVAAASVPVVLAVLGRGESYGYDIIRQVRELSGGRLDFSEGTLYPVLRKLEERGLVETEWRKADNERQRKYYRLKDDGRATLDAERRNWNAINSLLQNLWNANPALT